MTYVKQYEKELRELNKKYDVDMVAAIKVTSDRTIQYGAISTCDNPLRLILIINVLTMISAETSVKLTSTMAMLDEKVGIDNINKLLLQNFTKEDLSDAVN